MTSIYLTVLILLSCCAIHSLAWYYYDKKQALKKEGSKNTSIKPKGDKHRRTQILVDTAPLVMVVVLLSVLVYKLH